jgi:hypothetical protein
MYDQCAAGAKIILVTVLLLLSLGGCASDPPPNYAAMDDAQCQSFGAKPGTDIYVNCRMQLASQREGEEAQKRAMVTQYLLNRQR